MRFPRTETQPRVSEPLTSKGNASWLLELHTGIASQILSRLIRITVPWRRDSNHVVQIWTLRLQEGALHVSGAVRGTGGTCCRAHVNTPLWLPVSDV